MNASSKDPRRSPRSKVLLAATVECAGEALPVLLRDLSEYGALLEIARALELDSEVLFRRNELCARGYVAWVRDNLAGVCFTRPLKPEVVLRHIKRPKPREQADGTQYRRPALTRPGMSPEERRWAEEVLREPLRRSR